MWPTYMRRNCKSQRVCYPCNSPKSSCGHSSSLGVTRVTRKNLHAANFVTCPPVRRNIPGFSVDPPLLASGVRKVSCSRARRRHAVVWNWIMLQWAQRFSNMQHPVFLCYNVNTNLKPTLNFYIDALGDKQEVLALFIDHPNLLSCSLEKRLKRNLRGEI